MGCPLSSSVARDGPTLRVKSVQLLFTATSFGKRHVKTWQACDSPAERLVGRQPLTVSICSFGFSLLFFSELLSP